MADEQRVRLVGDHPHRGATGTLVGGSIPLAGVKMVEVRLDPGSMASACYAEPKHMRPLMPDEDPRG